MKLVRRHHLNRSYLMNPKDNFEVPNDRNPCTALIKHTYQGIIMIRYLSFFVFFLFCGQSKHILFQNTDNDTKPFSFLEFLNNLNNRHLMGISLEKLKFDNEIFISLISVLWRKKKKKNIFKVILVGFLWFMPIRKSGEASKKKIVSKKRVRC